MPKHFPFSSHKKHQPVNEFRKLQLLTHELEAHPPTSRRQSGSILKKVLATLLILLALCLISAGVLGLYVRSQLNILKSLVPEYFSLALSNEPAASQKLEDIFKLWQNNIPHLKILEKAVSLSLVKTFIGEELSSDLKRIAQMSQESLDFIPEALGLSNLDTANNLNPTSSPNPQQKTPDSTKRYIIIFQNSQELRATGGFMGSYALLELNKGRVANLSVQDIYEPDGQYDGFIPAPSGVREYLSSGKGMRLPDTNWSPDLPSSAQDILPFFAFGKTYDIDGLILINLELTQDLLKLMGPVYLSDYSTLVTSENVADLARADREAFFPGSQQKKQFLQSLMTALKIKLTSEEPEFGLSEWSQFLKSQLSRKNIQFYASDPNLQQFLVQSEVAGTARGCFNLSNCLSLFLVESNVGINKVNQWINRKIQIVESNTQELELSIQLQNTSSLDDYVNYQRLLISPEWNVESISIETVEVKSTELENVYETVRNVYETKQINQDFVTLTTGEKLRQVGFLMSVPASQSQRVVIKLKSPHPLNTLKLLKIQKQSGLPTTSYSITLPNINKNFFLNQDMVLTDQ